MGDGTWNGSRIPAHPRWKRCWLPQIRAANYLAAGFADWGGIGWAIRFIDGVKVISMVARSMASR